MKVSELDFSYPENLVATAPSSARKNGVRILCVDRKNLDFKEITKRELLEQIAPGDVVVINDTQVTPYRVFAKSSNQQEELEVLFVNCKAPNLWQVMFPASRLKKGEHLVLPNNIHAKLVEKGLPQLIATSAPLTIEYFEQVGEMPLPPYIQKARGERHNQKEDRFWYQTSWAEKKGSSAAPTASLHFDKSDWELLRAKGVAVETVTLHVGLGTFLPVKTELLQDHKMHYERAEISKPTWEKIECAKKNGAKVWALGTTVARTLESVPVGLLQTKENGGFVGETNLFIQPGFSFRVVDCLMTNFHQPQSTLLALVAAFAGIENVKLAYQWAIERDFLLFSYGDLTVWK